MISSGFGIYTLNNNYLRSNARDIDASFVRLKNINVSIDLPSKFNGRQLYKSARIYLQAQHLFTITKYKGLESETRANAVSVLFAAPPLRSIAIGLQVSL